MLRVLSEYDSPIGSTVLRRELRKKGFLLSERTVRYRLQLLEAKDFVKGMIEVKDDNSSGVGET